MILSECSREKQGVTCGSAKKLGGAAWTLCTHVPIIRSLISCCMSYATSEQPMLHAPRIPQFRFVQHRNHHRDPKQDFSRVWQCYA